MTIRTQIRIAAMGAALVASLFALAPQPAQAQKASGVFSNLLGRPHRQLPKSWDKLMDAAGLPPEADPYDYDCLYDWVDDLIDYHDFLLAMGADHDSPQMVALDDLIDDAEDWVCTFGCGYAEVKTGAAIVNSGYFHTNSFDQNPTSDFGTGYMIGGGAGFEPTHGVTVGIEYIYHGELDGTLTATGLSGAASAHASTLMLETMLLPGEIYRPLRPYTTIPGSKTFPRVELWTWGGIGTSWNTLDNIPLSGSSTNTIAGDTQERFAWGIGLGARITPSAMGYKNIKFDIGYRYDHLGQFSTQPKFTNGSTEQQVKLDLDTHNIFIRGLYQF